MFFEEAPAPPKSDEDLEQALQIINDNAYNRKWLLARASWINDVIRTATFRDRHYHYAVETLLKILPTMLTGREFTAWWDRLFALLVSAQDLRDSDLIARLTVALASIQLLVSNPEKARSLLKQAENYLAGASLDVMLEAYARLIEAQILSPAKNFDPERFSQALELAARSDNQELKALIHLMVAVDYLHKHDLVHAGFHIDKIQEHGAVIKDPNMLLRFLLIKEGLLRQKGDWDGCVELLKQARRIFPLTLQNPKNYIQLCYEEGAVASELGDHLEALQHYQDALDHADGLEYSYEIGLCYLGMAVVNISLMRLDDATEAIEEAHEIWNMIGNTYLVVHALYTQGYIELLRGEDLGLAQKLLIDARNAAQEMEESGARAQLEALILDKLGRLGPAA